MMFANRISSSTSCLIWLPETSPPSSSRGVLRHRFESCNTSHEIMRGDMQPRIPHLGAGDSPLIAVANSAPLHPGRVGTVIGFGESERDAHRTVQQLGNKFLFLLLAAEVAKHQHGRQIADD